MIKGGSIITDWARLGAELAQLSDDEQVDFFEGFVKECKTFGTYYQAEMQLAAVQRHLSSDAQQLLKMLGPDNASNDFER